MVKGFYKDLTRILRRHGFERLRQGKGSHEIWGNSVLGRQTTVARTIMSKELGNKILKQLGINERL